MKQITKDVKLGGEVVETAKIDLVENEEDLNTLGMEKVIKLVNQQLVTNKCNESRAAHREKKPRASKRLSEILNILPKVTFGDGTSGWDKLNEISTIEGEAAKKEALDALLTMPEVVAAMTPPEAEASAK